MPAIYCAYPCIATAIISNKNIDGDVVGLQFKFYRILKSPSLLLIQAKYYNI